MSLQTLNKKLTKKPIDKSFKICYNNNIEKTTTTFKER